jgi:hypothetical protein
MRGGDKGQRTLVPGKETVVRRLGANWAFHLPEQHRVELISEGRYVVLGTPLEESIFEVDHIDDSDPEEVVIYLGEPKGESGPPAWGDQVPEPRGYPLPKIQEEFERLRGRWRNARLNDQDFDAWAQGASWEDKLRSLRHQLRART